MMAARSNLPTLSLHDALPIWSYRVKRAGGSRCETDPRHRRPRRPACDRGAELVRRALQRLFRERVEPFQQRSEEHTSELQSRQYLVCRLLLEKKNNQPSIQSA